MITRYLTARFSYRLILLMLLATIPAMLGGTWILSRKATDDLRAAGAQRLASTAENLASRVDSWVGDVARDLQLLSHHPDLTGMDPGRQRMLLQQFRKIYPQVTYAHTIGPDGINIARSDDKPPVDYHDREYFHRVMAGAPIARETLLRSRSTGHPALNQAAPILDSADKVLGVLVVGMDLNTLDDVVGAARYGRTGYSCVVDEQGRALAHPELTYASTLQDLRGLPPVQGVLRERVSGLYRFQDEQGIWWLAYAVPLTNGWSVVSLEQEAEVLAEAHQVLALAMLVMGVVAVVMISLTWLATRMMVRPIVSMTDTAIKIADGDWKQRIPEGREDELGTLAKAFNKMVGQLELSYRSVEEKVTQLSAALTERKQAEEQLTKLSLAVQQSPASVVITDLRGVIEYVNPQFTKATGYAAEEAIGQSPSVLKSGFHPAKFYQKMWDTILAGREWRGELCNRKKDGTLYWELTSISPIRNAQGDVTNFVAVKEDVTEQKLTEERLVKQSALLRVINQVLEKTLVCESDEEVARECITLAEQLTGSKFGLIGTVNEAGCLNTIALSNSGWKACRIPYADAIKMLSNREVRGILGHTLKEGTPLVSNTPASHPDSVGLPVGHVPVTAIMSVPLKRGEETFGLIALANKEGGYDSSDQKMLEALSAVVAESLIRKQAEEALRKKEEELRQSQKLEAVGALAGGVAHEFNNLLQAIQAFTRFALKGLSPDEQRYDDLQEVLKASERAASLTRQLLGFSRRQQFQPKDTGLNEILADLGKMLRPLIGENVNLQMILGDHLGLLHVDPTMIQQVVMNLCINARDAMPTGGKLLVKTEDAVLNAEDCRAHVNSKPGRYVRLTVSDTGTGMSPEVLSRIFEPFFSTKEVGKGTGLGLAMVYGVVQQHAGMIRVRSEPGQGSAFEIYLPTADAVSEAAVAPSSGAASGGTETILVAEDDPLVRAALVRTLTEAGYKVLSAADGEEAVKVFADNSTAIAMVLLDMIMPKMGGREAHEHITRINPDTPVVYCTGYDPDSAKLESAEAAGLCVVQKPVDPDILLTTIRELLDRRSLCPAE